MNRAVFAIFFLVVGALAFSPFAWADPTPLSSTTPTWVTALSTGYAVSLNYPLCPTSTGNTTLYGTVKGLPSNVTVSDANLFATIRRPNSTTVDVNFVNDLSGTYTSTFNFDQNGTYFIQAHAYNGLSGTKGDVNAYVYLGDLNWTIAFLNNGFAIDIGALGTIRNTVTNSDGNLVYDVNANTTIFYPDGSIADANETMSQTPDGEFAKSIFGPSPAGVYTVGSIFKCGNKYAYSGAGTFTVNASSTGGGDTGSGSGSGGGGGGAKTAQIIGFGFDPPLSKNAASTFSVTVQNLTGIIKDYLFEYVITHPSGEITTGEKLILAVAPYQPTTVVADGSFTPLEMGVYTFTGYLRTPNKIGLYDTEEKTYDVQGEHLLTLAIDAASTKTASGLTFPFTLNLFNAGDFTEENVKIEWSLIDPDGEEYFSSSFTATISVNEAKSYSFSPFIPIDAELGAHDLVVKVISSGIKQEKNLMFDVASPSDYYAQFIADLEVRIDQLEDKIDELQSKGFDVDAESLLLLDLKQELGDSKGMLLSGNFAGLNTQLLELSEKVTRLAAILDNIEQQAPLLSREGLTLILYIGSGLMLAMFLWFLFARRRKKEEEKPKSPPITPPAPKHMNKALGIDVTYYPALERENLKHKPLISDLLGLKERK